MEHTLLLSAGFEPIRVISWKKAIVLIFLRKAEMLEVYPRQVHSAYLTFKLPAVIKLTRYVKPLPRRIRFSRQNLFSRDGFTCQYCHRPYPMHQLTYDHIIPRSKGGQTSWTNVVTSCVRCNVLKGNKPLSLLNYRLLKKPEEPRWLPRSSHPLFWENSPLIWKNYLTSEQKQG